MAINYAQQWWIRVGGNVLNGGGYDSTVSGAGTNYADQDSPQLSLTDFATSGAGSTTLTSVTGGFTSAMIGNAIRIASGTNFQTGYYVVTGRTDTNTVTVDRTPTSGGAGSGGVGRLGGAFALPGPSLSNSATISTPLAPGHTINVRGGGTDTPSSADYIWSSYIGFPSGDGSNGYIRWIGYNGRPMLQGDGLMIHGSSNHDFVNFKFTTTGGSNGQLGYISGGVSCRNVVFEQNGQAMAALASPYSVIDCVFVNSGSTSTDAYPAIANGLFGTIVIGNVIKNWRGNGIEVSNMGYIIGNLIINCHGTIAGIYSNTSSIQYGQGIIGNTIYNGAGDGIKLTTSASIQHTIVMNNICANNAGWGLNFSVNSQSVNERLQRSKANYNCYYANSSGAINNGSLGANDSTSNPTFTNTSTDDFSIGTNLKALGFPATFRGSGTTGYPDIGATQRQEPAGGVAAGSFIHTGSGRAANY